MTKEDRQFIKKLFDSQSQRFEKIDQRFDGIDQRFDRLEEQVQHNGFLIEQLTADLVGVANGVTMLHEKTDRIENRVIELERQADNCRAVSAVVTRHSSQIAKLEHKLA